MKTPSPHLLQRRKFFLVLPLLVLPFVTLMFWVLDGGKISTTPKSPATKRNGLNVELPAAYLKDDSPLNKLGYYEKAAADSAKLEKFIQEDPYYKQTLNPADKETTFTATKPPSLEQNREISTSNSNVSASLIHQDIPLDPHEAQVYQKLEQLNKALQKTEEQPSNQLTTYPSTTSLSGTAMNKADIDRLEQMMTVMKSEAGSEDPEMQQLNGMLDKILDIQHPARVREKLRPSVPSSQEQILSVVVKSNEPISLLANHGTAANSEGIFHNSSPDKNGFYSLAEQDANNTHNQNTIPAVIHETQTLVEGAVVKLRLVSDVTINNILIPAGNFVFGVVSLNGERLNIQINSIRHKNYLFSVELTVFDLDGISGLYIPGAITREVAKQSADQAVQEIGLSTFDPSLGAQAANASIEAAKTLFSKKAKLVKVTVKAGYQVFLQDQKQKATS